MKRVVGVIIIIRCLRPSLISLMVSVEDKHHVYLLTIRCFLADQRIARAWRKRSSIAMQVCVCVCDERVGGGEREDDDFDEEIALPDDLKGVSCRVRVWRGGGGGPYSLCALLRLFEYL